MSTLDIHPASEEERLAAYRNVHDVWGGGLPLEQHVERRLKSVQHNRAAWYVGCLDRRVVTSLAAYPLRFHVHGEMLDGFAIGSVHTLAEFRGCGFAPQLIEWVERQRETRGERMALLYSDIPCRYYARLGYLECPSWQASDDMESRLSKDDSGWTLAACDPRDSLDELISRYASYHAVRQLAVARTGEYWRYTLAKQPRDDFHWLVDPSAVRRGYARISDRDDELRIADFALDADDAKLQTALIAAVAQLAQSRKRRISGWLPDWTACREQIGLQPREQERTMVKSLDAGLSLDETCLQSAHPFCEIDHV